MAPTREATTGCRVAEGGKAADAPQRELVAKVKVMAVAEMAAAGVRLEARSGSGAAEAMVAHPEAEVMETASTAAVAAAEANLRAQPVGTREAAGAAAGVAKEAVRGRACPSIRRRRRWNRTTVECSPTAIRARSSISAARAAAVARRRCCSP